MIGSFQRRWHFCFLAGAALVTLAALGLSCGEANSDQSRGKGKSGRFLYVAAPGIRNYLEFGGAGILVFDMDHGHQFVKRIQTPASQAAKPENIKGICANATTQKLYFTTLTKLYCLDLHKERTLWEKT